jgi:hypothetical protein
MHDVAGFAVLVIGVIVSLYLVVDLALPFIGTWFLGFVAFFGLAVLILRRGRRHPDHLPHLLKPGVAPLLTFLAFALPGLHGLALALTERTTWWPWVMGANLLLPVAWTSRSLVRHAREKRRFLREGHDIEEILHGVLARNRALGVDADRLEMVSGQHREPEPWELVAGEASGTTVVPPADLDALLERIATLRPAYQEVAATLSAALEEKRTGRHDNRPHPALAGVRARLSTLEAQAAEASQQTAEVLWDREPGM